MASVGAIGRIGLAGRNRGSALFDGPLFDGLLGRIPSYLTFTRASSGTRFRVDGTSETVSTDIARFDYNPSTLAARGLLVEVASTNAVTNNTMVGATVGTIGSGGALPTGWSFVGGTTAGLTAAIIASSLEDGINYILLELSGTTSRTTAMLITDAARPAAAVGELWTASTFIRLVSGSMTNITSVQQLCFFTGGTGDALTTANVTATSLRNGRATCTATAGASVTGAGGGIVFNFNSGAAVSARFMIGMPQHEKQAFATSVIPTTSAAATRAVDLLSIPAANIASVFPTLATEGTFVFEFTPYAVTSTTTTLMFLSDGTSNNRLQMRYTSSGFFFGVTTGGVSTNPLSAVVPSAGTTYKVALAVKVGTNQTQVCVNGTLGTASNPASLPAIATYTDGMRIGGQPGAIGPTIPAVHFRKITFYPTRLTDAQLQAVTT